MGQAIFIIPYAVAIDSGFTLLAIRVILAGIKRLKAVILRIVHGIVSSQVSEIL